MTTYYKATRQDGTDFRTSRINYAAALTDGSVIEHPAPHRDDASGYLSVSVSPTDCTGMKWPCRLFVVEPVGESWTPNARPLPNKRACHALRVVGERPAHETLGPQGEHVAALVERARGLSSDELARQLAAWAAARDAARDAVWDAAWGLVARDLIATEQYDALTLPWRQTVGRIHPDDAEVSA